MTAPPPPVDRPGETARKIATFSRWLESTPSYAGVSAEAVVWRRIGKLTEENGEVTQAWLGAIGENPRKGVVGCADDVVRELLDVATCALGAVEHFTGFDGSALDMLADHVAYIYERAGLERIWTVLAWSDDYQAWTKWTEWVDRATAEDEKANAQDEGHRARIVKASLAGAFSARGVSE